MFYKNLSCNTKTFYGITFAPDDIKEVPGYINDKSFVRIFDKKSKNIKVIKSKNKSEKIMEEK